MSLANNFKRTQTAYGTAMNALHQRRMCPPSLAENFSIGINFLAKYSNSIIIDVYSKVRVKTEVLSVSGEGVGTFQRTSLLKFVLSEFFFSLKIRWALGIFESASILIRLPITSQEL